MLDDRDIEQYQAYILYSKNIIDIIKRISNYLSGCNKMFIDIELKEISQQVCGENMPRYVELKSYDDVNKLILESENGYGIIFRVPSPKDNVYAIAFIPINNHNKNVIQRLKRSA
ncbi:hypothetical protein Igag_1591 [Ignisphaera aggregans DSM 17230]|uniref:Uncharacterized protein n=1 Tax=Ignisphaera aggregans (strain DSM 17230 / JCM 13409 / AQ1.S1) TaxID=583356 RepID=E0SRD9_IGNAA|nr:hypothetical protein Igag_1591 [Ignisphaera aggregans DSM 17230]